MTGTTRYRIVLRDELSDRFEAMFEPMEMNRSEGTTVLVGDVVDQAQLHGLLERVARLGIELISVEAEGSRLERTMTREGQMEIGPVDYMIVAFPGSKFRGEIAPALGKLVESGTIRIIDVAFVSKSESGDILAAELTELDPDVQEGLEKLGIEVEGLFNEEDLEAAGRGARARLVGRAARLGERLGPRGRPGDPRRRRRAPRLRAASPRGRPGRPRLGARQPLERKEIEMPLGRRRGPGLVGMAARTAVVAGTATAVSGRVAHNQQQKHAAAAPPPEAQPVAPAAPPPAAAAEEPAYMAELTQLAQLRDQGILSPEEFEAKKKQILGL